MGIFKLAATARRSSVYEARIRALGFDPRSISPNIHAVFCSGASESAEVAAQRLRLSSGDREDHILGCLENAADLLIMACVGPEKYRARSGCAPTLLIQSVADAFIYGQQSGSWQVQALTAVENAGLLSQEFSDAVEQAIDEQEE